MITEIVDFSFCVSTDLMILKKNEKPGHEAIGLNLVFEAIKLPAGIADLNSGLADVYAYNLSHISGNSLDYVVNGRIDKRRNEEHLLDLR